MGLDLITGIASDGGVGGIYVNILLQRGYVVQGTYIGPLRSLEIGRYTFGFSVLIKCWGVLEGYVPGGQKN